MPNRREFVKTVAGATVGLYATGRGMALRAQAPAARRQVMLGGRRIRVVDVHAHWDMPLGDVVKGTPFEDRAKGPGLEIASQDAVRRLGARGVTVGGHVNGESVTLPKYDVFWAKAAELGELVFMHPNGSANIIQQGALAGRGGLGNIVGNPLETTVFLSRLIFDGTFDRFPALRVCGAHGGGYLPSYLGRTEVACQRQGQNCIIKKRPSEYMRSQILADSMVFSQEGLRHLVAEMGVSQVVFGTDTPFNWPVTVDLIVNAAFLSTTEKEAILGGNLIKLLRITT